MKEPSNFMSEDSYTLKEFLAHSLKDMKDSVQIIHDDIKEIKTDGKETKEKVGIQNGRVRKLEDWGIEAQKVIENNAKNIETFSKDKAAIQGGYKVVLTVAVVVPIVCTTIFGLYLKVRDNEIEKKIKASYSSPEFQQFIQLGIDTAFNERFSSIEVQ